MLGLLIKCTSLSRTYTGSFDDSHYLFRTRLSKEDKKESCLLALIGFLQFLDLDLAHLKHGLHHALRLRVVLIIQHVA